MCEEDNIVGANIPSFGICYSEKNKSREQVTYLSQSGGGTVTGRPCTPVVIAPWLDGKRDVFLWDKRALTTDSCLVCVKGLAFIEFVDDGQEEAAKEAAEAKAAAEAGVYGSMIPGQAVSRGMVSRGEVGTGAPSKGPLLRKSKCDGFLIVKDASGNESLVYYNDKSFAPIGYVPIDELAGILGLLGYKMSVYNNNGRISGYVNNRYYSIGPYAEEGKIVTPQGNVLSSFFVAATYDKTQSKHYVKLDQFMAAIGLAGVAKLATKEEMYSFSEVYANGEKKPFGPPSPGADDTETKYGFIWPTEIHTVKGMFKGTQGRDHEHRGIDIGVMFVDVEAVAAGTVLTVGYTDLRGNYVYMDHGCGTQTVYEHLAKVYVSQGQVVAQGHVIALSGNSGRQKDGKPYPYHLHFELLMNVPDKETNRYKSGEPPFGWPSGTTGYHVDPEDYLSR
jgi:murein DD-endopeptidase MepM/ murein hydrolase activator NlpD